jgi:LacI family transcriptional regulator
VTARTENRFDQAPTIYDVARVAGVSHQTVSRLLKGQNISPDNRVRVEKALHDLDYRPNIAARNLATRQSHRIAALMYEMTQLGPIQIMGGASAAARKAGYVLDVVTLDPFDDQSINEAIRVVNQQDVAGILAFAPNDRMRERVDSTHFRSPLYLETEADDELDSRPNFNAIGADLATGHLLELGHVRIAHISGPLDWPSARIRAKSYTRALEARGLTPMPPFEGNWSAESGYQQTLAILSTDPLVTAIFAANDQMALGALHALAIRGIKVPDSVSVVGMDDTPEARFYNPSLSGGVKG